MARHEGRARREKSPAVPPLALGWPNCPEKAAKAPPSSASMHKIHNVMIPLPPLSVKFSDEERAKLKALAVTLGWTESQVVRDSVAHILNLIHKPDTLDEPKQIALARLALCNEENPTLLQEHIRKFHVVHAPPKEHKRH